MRRAPRDIKELLLVRHLPDFLERAAGEPDSISGDEWKYGAIIINVGDGEKRGEFYSFRTNEGGVGDEMLLLLGLSYEHVDEWIRGLSPLDKLETSAIPAESKQRREERDRLRKARFDLLLQHAVDGDPRVDQYLATRGFPAGTGAQLGLQFSHEPVPDGSRFLPGAGGMVAWATDEKGERRAGQILVMRDGGEPLLLPGSRDPVTGQPKLQKKRRTASPKRGWGTTAAFRIAAVPGHEAEPMLLLEGVEDAISPRIAGYLGPIAATLGKGGFKTFAPSCREVTLIPDVDVPVEEIEAYVEFHAAGGRIVRVAELGKIDGDHKDANDLLRAGMGGALIKAIGNAVLCRSLLGDIMRDLASYPLTSAGETRFDFDLDELAKRHKISKPRLRALRKDQRQAAAKKLAEEEAAAKAEKASAAAGVGTLIEPAESVPAGDEIPNKVLAVFAKYVKPPRREMLIIPILWSIASHPEVFRIWSHLPRLHGTSPSPSSGKTSLAIGITLITPFAQLFKRATTASLERRINKIAKGGQVFVPIIDEIDNEADLASEYNPISKLYNSNETSIPQITLKTEERQSGRVREIVDTEFEVLAPMAMFGIAKLTATMATRSVKVAMMRTADKPPAFSKVDFVAVAPALRRWVLDNYKDFKLDPEFPALQRELEGREADTWRPLVAIAETIGGDWPRMLQTVMNRAIGAVPPMHANQVILLEVRRVFDAQVEHGVPCPDVILAADLAREISNGANAFELFARIPLDPGARKQKVLDLLLDPWEISVRRFKAPVGYLGATDNQGRIYGFRREQFTLRWRLEGIDARIAAGQAEVEAADFSPEEPENHPAHPVHPAPQPPHETLDEASLETKLQEVAPQESRVESGERDGRDGRDDQDGAGQSGQSPAGPNGARGPLHDMRPARRRMDAWFLLHDVDEWGAITWRAGTQPTDLMRRGVEAHVARLLAKAAKLNGDGQ